MFKWILIVLAVSVMAIPIAAQGDAKDEKRLARLLDELRAIDADAWAARRTRLRDRIAKHRADAVDLRARAVDLIQRSEREEERAEELERELSVQSDLMKVVARLPAVKRSAAAQAAPVAAAPAAAPEPVDGPLYDFDTHVAPIFDASCTLCHEAGNAKGGLDLSSYATAMRGGSSGAVIAPGDPGGSRLYRLTARLERPYMPRGGGALSDEDLAVLREWILGGAPRTAADARRTRDAMKKASGADVRTARPESSRGDGAMPESVAPLERVVAENADPVTCVAASPRAPLLARPGIGQVVLFHSDTLERLAVLGFDLGRVEALDFSADGERLLAAGGDAGVRGGAIVWDVRTGAELFRLDRRGDSFLGGALDGTGAHVAVGGATRCLLVHDVVDGTLLHRITAHDDWILAVDFAPDGASVASGDRSGRVLVTDVRTGESLHVLDGHEGAVQSLEYSPDGEHLATAGDDGILRLWDPVEGKSTYRGRIHESGALSISWSPTGELASSGRGGRVRYWRSIGRGAVELGDLGDYVYAVAFDHSGRRVFAGAHDGRVRVLLIDPDASP